MVVPTSAQHDLRHTYASLARRAGADLRLLQKTMGHASITVTAHIYTDLYDDELDDVASAMDKLDDRQVHDALTGLALFWPYQSHRRVLEAEPDV